MRCMVRYNSLPLVLTHGDEINNPVLDNGVCGFRRIFDCRKALDTNAPEGLMVVRVNDITYWCQGFRRESRNVAPTFPQSCVLLWGWF